MPGSVTELREICQKPVEALNDLTGRLYGSRVSIHITRLFLRLGLSANAATGGMFAAGLLGAALLLFPGPWRVAGFALLVLHYLLDCADGEIARFHRRSSFQAAYFDYLAHAIVRSAAYLALGTTLSRELASPWPFRAAVLAMLGNLLLKTAEDLPPLLFAKKALAQGDREALERLAEGGSPATAPAPYRPGFRGAIRSLLVNWDLSMIYFTAAALLGVTGVTGPGRAEALLLAWYAAALPLQFLDTVRSDLAGGRLRQRLAALHAARGGRR